MSVDVGVVGDGDEDEDEKLLAGQFRQHGNHSRKEFGHLPMALLWKRPQHANHIDSFWKLSMPGYRPPLPPSCALSSPSPTTPTPTITLDVLQG